MKKVAVVTDSTCCLPPELLSKYDISVVPIIIVHGGRSYRDGIDISPGEVYRIMRLKGELPSTSTPSPQDFVDTYHRLSHEAESILCITLNGLLSTLFETAQLARDITYGTHPGCTIEVLDSRAVAGALGFVVLEAARAAGAGADLSRAVQTAEATKRRVSLLAILDTLYYLEKGGRIGKAAALAGSLLGVKPILELSPVSGEATPVARPRTQAKAISRMLQIMEERAGQSGIHAMVHHADAPEDAVRLREEIESRFNCVELYTTEFTPGMGVHTGPGLLGISYYVVPGS